MTTFSFVLFGITLALYNEKGKLCSRISYWNRPYTLLSRSLNFKVKKHICYSNFKQASDFKISIYYFNMLYLLWFKYPIQYQYTDFENQYTESLKTKFENQTSAIFLHCKCGKSNGTKQFKNKNIF